MKSTRYYLLLLGFALALWGCSKDKAWDADPEIVLSQGGEPLEKLFLNSVSGAENDQRITVTSTKAWTIEVPQAALEWLTVEPTAGGTGTTEVTFSAGENDTYALRSADLKFVSGDLTEPFTVSQAQNDALILSEPAIDLTSEGGEFEIVVKSNLNYTVEITEGADWISQVPTRSLTENTLKFQAGEYVNFTENRRGSIVIKATDSDLSQTVPVTQMSIDTDLPNLYVAEAGTLQQVVFTKTTEPWTLTELNVIGQINAVDIAYLAANMTGLKALKMDRAEIEGGTLPETAFYNNQTLTEFTFPKNTEVIGAQALGNCKALSNELILPEGLKEIGEKALYYAGFIGDLKLPEGLVKIGAGAFSRCESLSGELVIPAGVTEIPADAFYLCGISGLTLPESVTSVGDNAFAACKMLTGTLTLPEGLTSIGGSAFARTGYTGDLKIPSTVTSLGERAFSSTAFDGKLTLPASLTEIPDYAFQSCPFAEILLPEGLTAIGSSAFSGAKITSLTLPASLRTLDGFGSCTELTSLIIPEGVEVIASGAFSGCKGLSGALTLPSSLKTIESSAFRNCTGLTGTVAFPAGMTSIPSSVLAGCTGITQVVIPATVTEIESSALAGTSITNIDLPAGLTQIGSGAFEGCEGLTKVQVPDGVISLGGFQDCINLETINIPATVTSISRRAFEGCTKLTAISIPSSVTEIVQYAFSETAVKSVTIPSSVVFGSSDMGLFKDCLSLETAVIEDGATTIPPSMFDGCTALKNVTIPASVTLIKSQSFMECTSLTSVQLPAGLTKLEDNVFKGSGLVSIDVPEGVTTIGSSCFSDCASLATATLPASLTTLSNYAFDGAALTSFRIKAATPPDISSSTFSDVSKAIPLYVPAGSKAAYQAATGWSEFTNIQEQNF